MQKKEGINPASGASEKVLEVTPSRMLKTPFWNVGQTLHSSIVIPKVKYYIVLYSINIVVGSISPLSLLENVKATNTSKKKERWTEGGKHCFFAATEGQAKELGG